MAAGVGATVTGTKALIHGDHLKTVLKKTLNAAKDGFADGFMSGGVTFGLSRVAGYITTKTGIFKRAVTYGKNNFLYGRDELTIWRHGRNFRIDTNVARGLHYHLRTASTGIGVHRTKWINEIIGGLSGLLGTLLRGTK